jgi:hypothetical protein
MWTQTLNLGSSTWSLTQSSNGRFSIFDAPQGGGTERFSILSTGNVGIGTTSPSSKLSVYGDVHIEGTNRYLNFGTTTGSSGYGFRDNSGTLEFKNSGGVWNTVNTATTGPSFRVTRGGSATTTTNASWTKIYWTTEDWDTNNNFTSHRFTPTVAGKYYITINVYCGDNNGAWNCWSKSM